MSVKLISYTTPSDYLKQNNVILPEDLIAFCARVSNPSNSFNTLTYKKLLRYLKKHHHWSPFEFLDITLEIETTRDIGRQLLRHKSFAFQEFSQRYADVSCLGDMFEISEARLQDTENRQNSVDLSPDAAESILWKELQEGVIKICADAYRQAIDAGIAKEVARKVLPEGLTRSRLYMKGSVRSWIHYLEVRGPGSGTQKEHMLIASKIVDVISTIFPMIVDKGV